MRLQTQDLSFVHFNVISELSIGASPASHAGERPEPPESLAEDLGQPARQSADELLVGWAVMNSDSQVKVVSLDALAVNFDAKARRVLFRERVY